MSPYALGAHRSPADARDYPVSMFLPTAAPFLPATLDLRPYLQPVRDQGQEGTCVAFALASGCMGYAEVKDGASGRILSPRDVYAEARLIQAPPNGAEGSYPRPALQAAQAGVCLESDRPYAAGSDPGSGPLTAQHRTENKVATYSAVSLDPAAIQSAIYHYGPVLVALSADDGFMSPAPGRAVIVPGGAQHGGHSVALVGWRWGCWLVRNSWGMGWGDGGYAWLPYSYPLWEAWSLTPALLPDGTPPAPPTDPWWDRMMPWLKLVGL